MDNVVEERSVDPFSHAECAGVDTVGKFVWSYFVFVEAEL